MKFCNMEKTESESFQGGKEIRSHSKNQNGTQLQVGGQWDNASKFGKVISHLEFYIQANSELSIK